ncbi:MAG: LapA family protein [Chitinivibrionia bacterium]|nr:LapA family protein [Chitinivibrionia bacterium]
MRLKSILAIIYTAIIIVVVFSLTITAMQEEFINQSAAIKFLFWQTQPFPMISFIAATFVIGLFIGLLVAVVDNFHNRKIIKELRKQLDEQNETDGMT